MSKENLTLSKGHANTSLQQAEKRRRGLNFQDELRDSWKLVPNCFRMAIPEVGGSRPADSIILLPHVNVLAELKRTAGDSFDLNFLRKNQFKALVDFERVMSRNAGVVFVSFFNESCDRDYCFMFRLTSMLAYMRGLNTCHISLHDLCCFPNLAYPVLRLKSSLFDLRGIDRWLQST
jgi:hypothetical protein